ncbi:hypothetical protein WJX82_002344 [Trebouxia sp. C0006]
MSQGRERIAQAATRRQHTEPVSSAAKVAFEPGSQLRAEARAEPQPAVTDSISFKHVKQEASTEGTEAVHFVSTERPGKLPPSAQQAEPSKDSATIADTSLGKPRKQRKPKAVVKTETVVVKEDLASPDASAAALSDESAKKSKPRKPRAKKVLTVEQLLESVDVVPYRERVMPKKWVGAHVSMGGGLERAVVRAASIGANAFALDTRSKRQWESKPIEVDTADKFKQACKDYGFGPEHILPHGSYLINLASADPVLLIKSYNAFVDELKRCETLGIRLYNFHPGSTCGKCPPEESMDRIAEQINKAHTETKSYLKGMHVNDSKAALGSKKDRHENVAKGLIGKDCFTFLMNDDRFNGIPLIMETPVQCEGPHIDYKLSLLAGGPVYKGPSEAETGINTDKRDIAWLNSLSRD